MRLKAILFLLISFSLILYINAATFPSIQSPYSYNDQPLPIVSIIKNEKKIKDVKEIIEIINHIDKTYGNLYYNLREGNRLIVFFDPAHGKLKNGKWEGEETGRISCTGLPEEYYSIQISRKIYRLLSNNRFLRVSSTKDYIDAIKGDSNVYKNIPFVRTVELAKKEGAFIIISEHLNNISCLRKADGIINLPGIHITHDEEGRRYLTYVESAHNGFLTLYNKFDATGFSERYAVSLKKRLLSEGLSPNNWEFGTVADDRFSYFNDFPISVIFESGFISNPLEEGKLRDPEYQDIIVESQYEALIDSIRDVFGIDISKRYVKKVETNFEKLTLIKLSRIAIYYIQNCNAEKAVFTIDKMNESFINTKHKAIINSYNDIKKTLIKSDKHYQKCRRYLRARKYKTAEKNLLKAIRSVKNSPVCSAFYDKYNDTSKKHFKKRTKTKPKRIKWNTASGSIIPKKASYKTPIIFVVEQDKSLQEAIDKALSPTPKITERLIKSFKNACTYKKIKVRRYSKKKRRLVTYWKWKKKKIDFNEGIYVIKINKKYKITKVKRVNQVPLNSSKYQNQQYLKNSYFAYQKKHRSL